MKIKASILGNPEFLENQKISLNEAAYPAHLSFDDVNNDVIPLDDPRHYCVMSFVYDYPCKSLDVLFYTFTDFVSCAARVHNIKVWFDSILENY